MTARIASVHAALGCIVLAIAACVTRELSPVPFSVAPRPAAGMALVYVFRNDAYAAPNDLPSVRLDGKAVVALHAAEYTAVHVPAGRHTVSTDLDGLRTAPPSPAYTFTVAPGQVAALALDYVGAPPPQSGMLETKGGDVALPRMESTRSGSPFLWALIPDIEGNVLLAELRKRRYRAAETRELAPG